MDGPGMGQCVVAGVGSGPDPGEIRRVNSDRPPDPAPRDEAPPALVAGAGRAVLLDATGEVLLLDPRQALRALRDRAPPLLVHAPATARRLGSRGFAAFDLLELFAFVHPAKPAAPTPRGLALALGLEPPEGLEQAAGMLADIADLLLGRLASLRGTAAARDVAAIASRMQAGGWSWGSAVVAALGTSAEPGPDALRVWKRLPEWEEPSPRPPPAAHAVLPEAARTRLATMLGGGAEPRPTQADYAAAVSAAFGPREARGDPHMVLAEAGTGTGKTLGYIAPATLWAETNGAPVWVSTYTRHLQRQVEAELSRLHRDPASRRAHVVVRKGRENYLCLLNYEEAVAGGNADVALGLIARWIGATSDGDIAGGDLPGWFVELFGPARIASLVDRRGECIHAGCFHWRRCFPEHVIRRAQGADIVVANHALTMAQAVWGGLDDQLVPTHYVFDEGHHLFDAADSAFAVALSAQEAAELRRWLLGAEGGRSRARGLRRRIEELVLGRPALEESLAELLRAARALPARDWMQPDAALAGAAGPGEQFLAALRAQVLARCAGEEGTLECDLHPVAPALADSAGGFARALSRIAEPARALARLLEKRLDDEAEELDASMRNRIEAVCRSLNRRVIMPLGAWMQMLEAVGAPPPEPGMRQEQVMFLRLERRGGAEHDAALLRHWLDPTIPFATSLARPAQGLVVTSATLRDAGETDVEAAWLDAEARVGATHLPSPALRVVVPSAFDYRRQTRLFVVTDVAPELDAVAAAYRELFLAAGGGGLGLFTAIARLRAVHSRIAEKLEAAGIPLYAQHVDAMDNATLVDVFRAEPESCLLGTDAMRDGVDVPGRALRLVVFERVPWARPDILHRERRIHLGGGDPQAYDSRVARMRLRQAFGRLIRAEGDHGVFVLLDRRTPSRLLSAFPVPARRVGLAEAVAATREFLNPS
jgi:ATP-dependent DNA helicase DinG